jgi:hypothetical protein
LLASRGCGQSRESAIGRKERLGLIAARKFAPGDARRWVGILTSAFGHGQIVGPVIAGYGFDLAGSLLLPSMLAVGALCAAAILAIAIVRGSA